MLRTGTEECCCDDIEACGSTQSFECLLSTTEQNFNRWNLTLKNLGWDNKDTDQQISQGWVAPLFQVLKKFKQSLFNTVSEQCSLVLTLTNQNVLLTAFGLYYKNTKISTVSSLHKTEIRRRLRF